MSKKLNYTYVFILLIAFPFLIALYKVFSGNIPFWYDGARDLIAAWDNLHKPVLIGPQSGVPNLFYGPYWTWLLSVGLIFSKNPRAAFISATIIPYFIVFPLVLYQFKKIFDLKTISIIWLIFIFSAGSSYTVNTWNPYIAPVLLLFLIYILVFDDNKITRKWTLVKLAISGFIAGVIVNVHISFGIGVFFGTTLYHLISPLLGIIKQKKIGPLIFESFVRLVFYTFGALVAFLPFIIFELRHGFNQVKAGLYIFTKIGAVVGPMGLDNNEIIEMFMSKLNYLLHLPAEWSVLVGILLAIYITYVAKNESISLQKYERRLITYLIFLCMGVLGIFFLARNPVWDYHFIGVEIIFLLLLGIAIQRIRYLKHVFAVFAVIGIMINVFWLTRDLLRDPLASTSLASREYVVDLIAKEARGRPYTVYSYSQSVYTFDYTYLFKQRHGKDVPADPNLIPMGSNLVFLIIPREVDDGMQGIIDYRTPPTEYRTTNTWNIPDGTRIIMREK